MPWNEDGTRKSPYTQRVEPTSDNPGGDETYASQDKPEPAVGSPYTMKGHALPGPFQKVKRHYDSYNAAKAANAPVHK